MFYLIKFILFITNNFYLNNIMGYGCCASKALEGAEIFLSNLLEKNSILRTLNVKTVESVLSIKMKYTYNEKTGVGKCTINKSDFEKFVGKLEGYLPKA